ncbi:DUF5317 domain-containing protein [Acetobacterium carbinolicum]|uniref:DUF5317 domain-containing protein n=1 Tax=Acetobacterium TaxID=33951 RepID=UPI000DBECA83|nr:DUF5317 domain-containing protein [Acetobacterium sp. KB-1]AWW26678.1 hypothetical protein DOZ58_08455 [Acetobacterium sp. KB-1]
MLILIAIMLGFLIGKIRRGSLHGFKVRKISLLPVGILGLVLQIALHLYIYTGGIALVEPYLEIVNFASYILILVMLVFNLDDFWVILMAVGITANFVVIFINGGHMPVSQGVIDILPAAFGEQITQGLSPIYSLIQPNTLLWFLGINLPFPIPYVPLVMSLYGSVAGITVGTIVTVIGLIGFIQYVMNKKASIMHDERNDHGEDEGIFGDDEDNGIDRVSTQDHFQEGYDEPEDVQDEDDYYYRDMAATGGIRGDRDEHATTVIPTEGFNSGQTAEINGDEQTRLIPADLDGVDSGIGTETEEIVISNSDVQETRVMEPVDDGSTKIISNIQEVGTYVKGDKELEAADMEEILNSDDAGFFTKKYYEEKLAVEKERLILQMREIELNKVAKSLSDPDGEPHPVPESDLRIVESFKLTDLDQPFVLRSENSTYDSGVRGKDEEDLEFSEDEMLNVWQRLNLEDEKRKVARRKQLMKETSKEAEILINGTPRDEVGIPLKEIEEVTEPVVGRVYESTDEDKEKMLADMDDDERKDFQQTVDERKRAGYELVELKLDGKDVAFWRKKK